MWQPLPSCLTCSKPFLCSDADPFPLVISLILQVVEDTFFGRLCLGTDDQISAALYCWGCLRSLSSFIRVAHGKKFLYIYFAF